MASILLSAAVLAGWAAFAAASEPDPKVVRRELADILSRPEYNRTYAPSAVEQWARQMWDRVTTAIGEFFTWLRDALGLRMGQGTGNLASFLMAWAVIVAFVVLLALVMRGLNARLRLRTEPADETETAYGLPSPGPLIRQAARLAEAGDLRGAFRSAYLACISHLDGMRALRFERSRTNWEYLQELKSRGFYTPYDRLRPLTADFDRKIYGREKVSLQDYLNAVSTYRSLTTEAPA